MLFPVQTTALLLIGAAWGVLCSDDDGKEGCLADNCARAVTGTRYSTAIQASHRADCSSFLLTTVTPAPATITVTVTVGPPAKREALAALAPRQVTVVPSSVPAYASACSGVVRYRSACSCAGITAMTTIAPTPTVTQTVTVTGCPVGSASCQGGACQDTLSDPNNCGACNNVCVSGVCQNGVCAVSKCNGSNCGSLNNCGQNCFCFETSSGAGFCGPGTSCAPLPDCNSNADCAVGTICATGTCCGRNVCLGPQGCENGVGVSQRSLFGRAIGELRTNGAPPAL